MEQNFKIVIEKIKESTIDSRSTQKNIMVIKKILDDAIKNCKNEANVKEILQEFLEEYQKELEFRGKAEQIYYHMLQYRAYKELLANYKGNKNIFNNVVREAKRKETHSNQEDLTISKDLNQCMVTATRNILRHNSSVSEKNMVENIQQMKVQESRTLKARMIEIIQQSVSFLEEYGFLDEYIEECNKELDKLNLEKLKFKKRNPIPDEEYDGNGNLIENKEDIGIMDSFTTEELDKIAPEDLAIMTAFWESRYLEGRIEISKAMSTINNLNLWEDMLKKDIYVDEKQIEIALKKDLALTYLSRSGIEINSKIRRQYAKFLKENGMDKKEDIQDSIDSVTPESRNLESAANDIAILQGLIMFQLQEKDLRIKHWGVIEEDKQEDEKSKTIRIALEHQNFRGPLLMQMPREILNGFLDTEDTTFLPIYKNVDLIDENYENIMSKIYLPSNEYFKKIVKEAYRKNPESELLTVLNGKKPKNNRSIR